MAQSVEIGHSRCSHARAAAIVVLHGERALRAHRAVTACRIHRFGSPDVIEFEEVGIPIPGPDEVLVRVGAAGVGPWDGLVRSGASALPQSLPLTLGADLCGTIEASGTSDFTFGEAVYGVTNTRFTGAYAQYAVASRGRIARKPQRLGIVESAAVPVVAITALQMLDRARVGAGTRVLVHGAAGGVGGSAIQLAVARGASIVATMAGDDTDYVRSLGAEVVIDTRSTRFETASGTVDAVLDTIGGEVKRRSFDVLERGGTLVSVFWEPELEAARKAGIDATWLLVDVTTQALETVTAAIEEGRLRVRVGTVLSLGEAREAHEMLEGSLPHSRGKIVLRTPAFER